MKYLLIILFFKMASVLSSRLDEYVWYQITAYAVWTVEII